jgi:hypothetical protein
MVQVVDLHHCACAARRSSFCLALPRNFCGNPVQNVKIGLLSVKIAAQNSQVIRSSLRVISSEQYSTNMKAREMRDARQTDLAADSFP